MSEDRNDDSILSEAEVIPLSEESVEPSSQPKEEQDEEPSMGVEEALEVAERVGQDVHEDVGVAFEDETLEAAAVLKDKRQADYARLKADVKSSEVDTNDWKAAVKDQGRELRTKQRRSGDDRPVIMNTPDMLHHIVDDSAEALEEVPGIYERGGEIVKVVDPKDGDGPRIHAIDKGGLKRVLSEAVRYERRTNDGAKPIRPPNDVVDALYSESTWGLDHLEGFVDGACMLGNGDILATNGYHPDANLFVRHAPDISMQGLKSPTQEDAHAARRRIIDLLCDFELVQKNRQAHEAAWLACLLTIVARPAIGSEASTPLFLFDANRPRTGKTRMAEMACEIATGRSPHPQPAPTGRNSNDEWRKTITGIARSGVPIAFFDNVKGTLGGASLELAITARRWSARILKESKMWEGRLNVTWVATANNVELTTDMAGRTLLCRIESRSDAPEKRSGFKYPRIMQHVRENRARYLKDALTILRAWHVADRPDYGMTPWGSFEEWSNVIRNAVVFAGGEDPCETRKGLDDADREMSALETVIDLWPEGEGFTAKEIAEGIKNGNLGNAGTFESQKPELLAGAIHELVDSKSPVWIGRKLGDYRRTSVNGKWLVKREEGGSSDRVKRWYVEEVEG